MAARKKARALTRKITRNEALSYERSVPNPLGVTHIAEINGRDAYRRRYRATVELLGGKMRKRGRRRMRRNFEGAGSFTPAATPLHELAGQVARAQRRGRRKAAAAPGSRKRRKRVRAAAGTKRRVARKRKLTKAERAAISRRNLRKAQAALGRGKRKSTAKKRRKAPKDGRAAARARPLFARIGGVKRRTYLTRGKKGRVRRMSTYAILGYPTSAAMKKALKKGSKSLGRRMESVRRKRASAAARASKQILEGRGLYSMFTPNRAGGDVVSYEEWKGMKPNKKRKKKTARRGKRRQTAAQRRASLRNLAKGRRARKSKSASPKRRRKGARRSKRGKLTKAQRRAISIRNLKKAHRAARKGTSKRRRRRAVKRGRKSVTIRMVANKRRRRKGSTRRRRRTGLRTRSVTLYASNRRRRGYRRNFSLGGFVQSLKGAVKIGIVAAVGFGAHRTLTRLLDQYALSKVPQLQTGKLAEIRPMLAGALVIMGGNALVSKLAPRYAGVIGGGMAVSFMVDAIVRVLTMVGQPNIAGYFSGYADAGGRAYSGLGSYYNYRPGETFNGYGEFYEPMSGFGAHLEQAAAGYGQLQQAAAGYPALQQAAAGVGEYTAYGAQAIGEYEETPYSGYGNSPHVELAPNLSEAEQALTIAEAAAGLGSYGDLPGRMTVEPMTVGSAVPDEPGGSRAGIMAGRDGIFG